MVNNGQVVDTEMLGKAFEGCESLLVGDVSLNDLGHLFAMIFAACEGLTSFGGIALNNEPDIVVRVKLNMFIVTKILTPSNNVVILLTFVTGNSNPESLLGLFSSELTFAVSSGLVNSVVIIQVLTTQIMFDGLLSLSH
jgi:hypothetical protein